MFQLKIHHVNFMCGSANTDLNVCNEFADFKVICIFDTKTIYSSLKYLISYIFIYIFLLIFIILMQIFFFNFIIWIE